MNPTNNNDSFFKDKEEIGEQLFRQLAAKKQITKYRFSPLESAYDIALLSGCSYLLIENKVRPDIDNKTSLRGGPFLELTKIIGMEKEQDKIFRQTGIKVLLFYFNYVKDAVQIFRLKEKHLYNFNWKELPKSKLEPKVLIQKMVTPLFNPEEIIFQTNFQ